MATEASKLGRGWRLVVLVGLSVAVLIAVALSPAIPQPIGYHDFADQRAIAGVRHFWNVLSNLPFAVVGIFACLWLLSKHGQAALASRSEWAAYFVFFFGEFLTCFGSAYYHAAPNNETLVWDRLVFSLLLTSFFVIVVGELLSRRLARALLVPGVLIGTFSVLQWHWTELAGAGDLRLYLVVQFYPVLATPVIIALFGKGSTASRMFLATWLFYGAAKLCETFDASIYEFTGTWSGHTLKHFIAAAATVCLLRHMMSKAQGSSRPAAILSKEVNA